MRPWLQHCKIKILLLYFLVHTQKTQFSVFYINQLTPIVKREREINKYKYIYTCTYVPACIHNSCIYSIHVYMPDSEVFILVTTDIHNKRQLKRNKL